MQGNIVINPPENKEEGDNTVINIWLNVNNSNQVREILKEHNIKHLQIVEQHSDIQCDSENAIDPDPNSVRSNRLDKNPNSRLEDGESADEVQVSDILKDIESTTGNFKFSLRV